MGTFVAVACGFPLLSLRRYRALLIANGLGLVVTLALSLSLVPVLAAHGAAIATVAAELTLASVAAAALVARATGLRLPLGIVPIALAGRWRRCRCRLPRWESIPSSMWSVGTVVYALLLAAARPLPARDRPRSAWTRRLGPSG